MERQYFPLCLDQIMIANWGRVAPPAMMNLPCRIDIESELNEELFLRALRISAERLSYARLRLHDAADGSILQYISEPDELEFPEPMDCTDWTEEKIARRISKWAGEAFPKKQRDVQLFRTELLRVANGRHILYFCGFHVIMDIYAIVYFMSYVDEVYYALTTGGALPREGASPEAVTRKRNAYLQSERHDRDYEAWVKMFTPAPHFTSINGLGGKEFIKGENYGHDRGLTQMLAKELVCSVPSALEEKINRKADESGVSPNMLYCLALRTYLAAVNKTDDVLFINLVTLRSGYENRTSGMTRAAALSFRTIIPDSTDFDGALRRMEVVNRETMRRAEYTDTERAKVEIVDHPEGTIYYTAMVSYVPFLNYDKLHLKIRARKIESGVSLCPLYMLILHDEPDAELHVIYQYSVGYVKPESVEKFHAFLLKFLEAGLAEPSRTLRELTDEAMG